MNHIFPKRNLCLIGGGHSHVRVIKQLGMHPIASVKMTLISNDRLTAYSGMLPGLIAGHYTFNDCHIDIGRLCQWAGIQFIRNGVQQIDPLTKKIFCHAHTPLSYDLLSLNIGSQPALNDISGALVYGHPVKPIKQFLLNWHRWLDSVQSSNRTQHIVIIGGGAAGIEILLAMQYKFRSLAPTRAMFTLVCADQTILHSHNNRVQEFFKHHLQIKGITTICGKHVTSIDEHQLILNDHTQLSYDFCAWAIHAGAQHWPADSGLQCDNQGFIMIDQYLRSISHPSIFATGDCAAFTPTPLPKAGVYAVRQGSVLANNIVATLKNRPLLAFKPQKHFLSLLTTGHRQAVASRGPLFASGKWVWLWKDYIDRAFIERFNPKRPINKSCLD